MIDTNNEFIESFLDQINDDIKSDKLETATDRLTWLLSMAAVTDNKNLFVIEGILRKSIRRFQAILEKLNSQLKEKKLEKKKAEDLFKKATDAMTDIIAQSKDYLHFDDKTKFFDSVAQDHYTLQEIAEMLRLEVYWNYVR